MEIFTNKKIVKLALGSLLLIGALTGFAPKTAAAATYTCPPMCCAYRFDECISYHYGIPAGNGWCYYDPCPGTGGGGTDS